jgi:hypothetical protein
VLVALCAALLFSSCAANLAEKLKADAIVFNDNAMTSYTVKKCIFKSARKQSAPYNLLDSKQKSAMNMFVMTHKPKDNTAAYYALDLGLDRIKYVKKKFMGKDPNSKYYIITLTDGLDNISTKVAENNKQGRYSSGDDYARALQSKMQGVMGSSPNKFQSYCLVYMGGDLEQIRDQNQLSDDEFQNFLKSKLSVFTGAQNASTPTVIPGRNFNDMLEDFKAQFLTASFDFVVPKDYAGKPIRMVLKDAKGEEAYVEGNFVKDKKSYRLENIRYSDGFGSEVMPGSTISATNAKDYESTLAQFSINKLQLNGTPYKVASVGQRYEELNIWAINTEYRAQSASQKNAYILLLLDASSSFGENFTAAQRTIFNIVAEITK